MLSFFAGYAIVLLAVVIILSYCFRKKRKDEGGGTVTTLTVGDQKYVWGGGLGQWFVSYEPKGRLQVGDCRELKGRMFVVYSKYKHSWRLAEYNWVAADDDTKRYMYEDIRKFLINKVL